MFTRKETGERTFVPITPEVPPKQHRNTWLSIGTAIILISIVIAVLLGAWAALT